MGLREAISLWRICPTSWANDQHGAAAASLMNFSRTANAKSVSTSAHPVNVHAGFSINGWLAVLLTFLLARVFAEGALMREDLEGTV